VLEPLWVNARGAIARFDRGSIEIRAIDTQECASADIAVVAVVCALLRGLVEQRWGSFADQKALATQQLADLLVRGIECSGNTRVDDAAVLKALGFEVTSMSGRALWSQLVERLLRERLLEDHPAWDRALDVMTRQGSLAERIVAALGPGAEQDPPERDTLLKIYHRLIECLASDTMFEGS
jgi:carboxylate-amine ligase